MALTPMAFSPATGFRDATTFPDPATEALARDQMQDIPDQLRDYINNTFLAELLSTTSGKGASQIGVQDSAGRFTAADVEGILAEIAGSGRTTESLKGLADSISTHKAEKVYHIASATRDLSVAGTQTISGIGFTPQKITAIVNTTEAYKNSEGYYINGSTFCNFDAGLIAAAGAKAINNTLVKIANTSANYTTATITATTSDSATLTWAKTGTGATGTANIIFIFEAHY